MSSLRRTTISRLVAAAVVALVVSGVAVLAAQAFTSSSPGLPLLAWGS